MHFNNIERYGCFMNKNNMDFSKQIIKVQKSINRMSELNKGSYNVLIRSMNEFARNMKYNTKASFYDPNGLSAALKNIYPNNLNDILNYNYSDEFKDMLSSVKTVVYSAQKDLLKQLKEIDFSPILSSAYRMSDSFKDLVDAAYGITQEKLEETEIKDNIAQESEFANSEEVQEAINEHIKNPKGFQAKFANWSQKKIVQYYIIWKILSFMWTNFGQPYFQENVGMPFTAYIVSNVKELPEKGAEVICQIKENIEGTIIANTNYYYKVSFTDENGIEREGYVAKRNLKLLEEKEDISDNVEEETTNGQE